MTPFPHLFAQGDPAGGAAISEVVLATGGALLATTLLFALGFGHRAGKTTLLERSSAFAGRVGGLPAWVALPSAIGTASLITALLGMYWEISLHIDQGRDAGPLANPAHYLILFGLFGIFAAGFLSMTIPKEKPCPTAIRLYDGWHAPLGGVLMAAAGGFALIGFPLDDVWHRLFGQDVTLWGPTHLMLIGGASVSLVGQGVLLGVPVYLPNDPAIPAKGVPARASFERPFVRDTDILQREAKEGAAGLNMLGYGIVLTITLSIIALNAWALVRLATVIEHAAPDERREPPRRAPAARQLAAS